MTRVATALRPHLLLRAAALCAVLAITACSKPAEDVGDAGTPPPDLCNSIEEALSDPQCELTLGEPHQAFINPPDAAAATKADQDWYSFRVPATANARTLVHLRGGYAAPNTAVNLSLNLLREDGNASLSRKSDRHGQAAPKAVDIVLPFAEPNARLVVLVADDPVNPSRPNFDLRSPYNLTAEVLEDPDVNEPNDEGSKATPIVLTAQGAAMAGTQHGWLSTTGDVDTFSFDAPVGKVLYLHVTAPEVSPPPAFRLSYELYDPEGTRVSEGVTPNEFIPVNLATARKVAKAGKWQLKLVGYVGADNTDPAPGNLDLQYTVDVKLFDEADPNDLGGSNDTLQTAVPMPFTGVGQTQTKTGRLGFVPDPDWYKAVLPSNPAPTVLHYKLRPSTAGGRFEPLSDNVDRRLQVLREVNVGTEQDNRTACMTDETVCPKGFSNDGDKAALVAEQCQNYSTARCLWSQRQEAPKQENLHNFEGTLPVAPHAAPVEVFFQVYDEGTNWADDRDYTLEVSWVDDADEASRFSGGVEQTTVLPLNEDITASFPTPPANATVLTGTLSHGPGFFREIDPNEAESIRGPKDYDAVNSDADHYELSLPVAAGDLSWSIQWELEHVQNGVPPSDIALDLEFCDATGCDTRRTLGYTKEKLRSWHNSGSSPATPLQMVYDLEESATKTTVTARAYGCFCIESAYSQAGKLRIHVVGVDRKDWSPTKYTIRTAWTTYPQSFPLEAGGTMACPVPCGFTQ